MPTSNDREAFAQRVVRDVSALRAYETKGIELTREARQSLTASAATTGHPMFHDVRLNQSRSCEAVAMFVDLEAFTARTFWDPPEETVRLARGVLGQVAQVVGDFGGHVLGLRGDGLFACFGPNEDPEVPIVLSVAAGAYTLDVIQNGLNETLRLGGTAPVQARVGADYGRLDFTRMGTETASEVNVIGFAANFAAKCEKYANSWEFVAGESFTRHINQDRLLNRHPDSPKEYQRDYKRQRYAFGKLAWAKVLGQISGIKQELAGRSASTVSMVL